MSMAAWALFALMPFIFCGCAAERATWAIADSCRQISTALIEKSNITSSQASLSGEITDPAYTVDAFYVQGIHFELRTKGIRIAGQISGQGEGPDKPLAPETIAELRRRGLGDNEIEALARALSEMVRHATTRPANP